MENLSRQIEFNNSQIAALQSAKARDQAQFSSQLAAQARAPLVRQQIANLERRLSGYSEQFEEVSGQLTNAQSGVTEVMPIIRTPRSFSFFWKLLRSSVNGLEAYPPASAKRIGGTPFFSKVTEGKSSTFMGLMVSEFVAVA